MRCFHQRERSEERISKAVAASVSLSQTFMCFKGFFRLKSEMNKRNCYTSQLVNVDMEADMEGKTE